tara:strand:+ start:1875 stop:2078 length:204 start_codon:yes stop_codon:yes gene_type:complete
MNRYKVTCKGRSVRVYDVNGWRAIRRVATRMREELSTEAEISIHDPDHTTYRQGTKGGEWVTAVVRS